MPKTQHTSEFKKEAVKLAQSSDKPTSVIAHELGIKPNTLYNWISRAMNKKLPNYQLPDKRSTKHRYSEMEQELKEVKKELKRAKMERDILKKAIAYFTKIEE